MKLVILSIILIAIAFAGIAIKILVKKNGQFSGTCSSNNPLLKGEGGACGICGANQMNSAVLNGTLLSIFANYLRHNVSIYPARRK